MEPVVGIEPTTYGLRKIAPVLRVGFSWGSGGFGGSVESGRVQGVGVVSSRGSRPEVL